MTPDDGLMFFAIRFDSLGGELVDYNEDYFNCLLNGWDQVFFPILKPHLDTVLQDYRPCAILDYGAGAGAYASVLSARGARVDACDISAESVALCEGKYAQSFRVCCADDLPLAVYDMIFCTEVLEHIEDYRGALAGLHGALREDGMLFLTTTTYAPSIFTMFYSAKGRGVSAIGILRETLRWGAGFFGEEHRDAFVRNWCFEPLGGHFHGFMRRSLLHAFREADFDVYRVRMLYPCEPLAFAFLNASSVGEILGRSEWSRTKRVFALVLYSIASPVNRTLRMFSIFANNILVIAVKRSDAKHTADDKSSAC